MSGNTETTNAPERTESVPTLGDLPAPVVESNGQVTVEDIANTVQVIDYAMAQGAFKGWHDVIAVLSLRNRLWGFVKVCRAQQESSGSGDREATADAGESAPTEEGTEDRRKVETRIHRREEDA